MSEPHRKDNVTWLNSGPKAADGETAPGRPAPAIEVYAWYVADPAHANEALVMVQMEDENAGYFRPLLTSDRDTAMTMAPLAMRAAADLNRGVVLRRFTGGTEVVELDPNGDPIPWVCDHCSSVQETGHPDRRCTTCGRYDFTKQGEDRG